MAVVGDILGSPETGYKRIDNNDSLLLYNSSWSSNSSATYCGVTEFYTTSSGSLLRFKFRGSKLRIIGSTNNNRGKNINIIIDGTTYIFSQYSSSWTTRVLNFDISNLSFKIHTVEIKNSSGYVALDAIDIDDNGIIIDYNKPNKLFLIKDSKIKYINNNEVKISLNNELDYNNFNLNGMLNLSYINKINQTAFDDKYKVALYKCK